MYPYLLPCILICSITAYFIGISRANVLAKDLGGVKQLHSLPTHYGVLTALSCAIPALVVFLLWSFFEDQVISSFVTNALPAELLMRSQNELTLVLNEIKNIESACKMFKIAHQRFPTKLEELVNPVQGMNRTQWGGPFMEVKDFDDPWSSPYKYNPDEVQDVVTISSAGPDRQSGTEDDIANNS